MPDPEQAGAESWRQMEIYLVSHELMQCLPPILMTRITWGVVKYTDSDSQRLV